MPRKHSKYRANEDELVRIAARKEARMNGTEYRPTNAAKSDEAERLNRGLSMMEENDDAAHEPDEE